MNNKDNLIKGLEELYKSMSINQCYACSYEFIETAKEFGMELLADAIDTIKNNPQIVRCKDCKYGEKVNAVYLCGKSRGFGIAHEPKWFCADGERK